VVPESGHFEIFWRFSGEKDGKKAVYAAEEEFPEAFLGTRIPVQSRKLGQGRERRPEKIRRWREYRREGL
jgi:hypothetical protein